MSKQANPTTIGAFIFGAILIVIAAIVIFSSGQWFSKKERFIVYFAESINGLNVGAPIKLSGVQIGQVVDISVERDAKLNKILVPVIFEIETEKIRDYVDLGETGDVDVDVKNLIKDGLRMQLQLSSVVTGQLFIGVIFRPDTPVRMYRHQKDLIEIPSIPSSGDEIQNTLRKALSDYNKIQFKELFQDLLQTVRNIESITGSEETKSTLAAVNSSVVDLQAIMKDLKQEAGPIIRDLKQTINRADRLLTTLDANAGPLLEDTRETISNANTTLVRMKGALANVEAVTSQDSPISQELETALKELSRAARSTRIMMDYLERHPDALIYGKGKDPVKR